MEVNVNDENFEEEVLNSDMPVLVDFWAPWYAVCPMKRFYEEGRLDKKAS